LHNIFEEIQPKCLEEETDQEKDNSSKSLLKHKYLNDMGCSYNTQSILIFYLSQQDREEYSMELLINYIQYFDLPCPKI